MEGFFCQYSPVQIIILKIIKRPGQYKVFFKKNIKGLELG